MEMLPEVIDITTQGPTSDPTFRQAAWSTVAVLAQSFGRGFTPSFLPLLDHVLSAVHTVTEAPRKKPAPLAEAQVLSSALDRKSVV